jgi:SAM-dependent methyltransferase
MQKKIAAAAIGGILPSMGKQIGNPGSMSIRSFIGRQIHRIGWNYPVVNLAVKVADPVDYMVRLMNGNRHIPRLSIRVRSVGITLDLGGSSFLQHGKHFADLLRTYAKLAPDSKVLEIGCGCGTNAFAVAEILDDGNYVGMDIHHVSLEAARGNSRLRRKCFQFELLDIRNNEYNPKGQNLATEYVFPYPNGTFDVVFLISVFTHMLTDEVINYARQITRILKPGGRCFFTAFLLDRDSSFKFPFRSQEHSYMKSGSPEICLAYYSDFLLSTFAENGMSCSAGPLWGSLHGGRSETGPQDILVFTKQ